MSSETTAIASANGTSAPLSLRDATTLLTRTREHLSGVVLGKPEVIRMALIGILAEGHLLIEDVPGVGKTLLAKAISHTLGCRFNRVQFTPDLLPGDLIGTSVLHPPTGTFRFQPGPIFAHIVLADEINRATPRTQSALLEAMSEKQVSIDGETRKLEPPFFVLATQNPFEFEGTYPLPESQLDRFLLRIEVGYPSVAVELSILTQHRQGEPVDSMPAVLDAAQVLKLQALTRSITMSDSLANYLLAIVHATRQQQDISLGASTRAALGFYRAAQATALLDGRDYVIPDDIKQMAIPVLAHRLLVRSSRSQGQAARAILSELLQKIPVPA
ncbi:AAA family ATPase [Tuwongella immobilis]|uniref:AAA+ ATPase domain-containing protein n=1 Tax=Tuwongella immobilis TaxID=692036 RepID=A0A6C2YPT1_9BACT|nr:MoxR family ATPase [Tuwongella immobilis]VIP02892.1 magnesium chelatase : ATPase associated with various cellular activities AAA_3 OS=Isosphaera pallida (strain ATCC 43644 / DSM 9630 / IS1B) GN=Isop_0693 PE=4 SV=1: AAA_3 [Tuwongella immobilis]VTS02764.1 magnesium chelatase : ATPase associated with various cellular activities AAA_3 OS=Isosphaera pallida (strain ATCC 43644 / DSM 9630 / IS1B) GN=Isop_0693 PE=4 SV=1: AAA_3 [Tuwongella immobilis]